MSGREKLMSLGTYPDATLKVAREKRDEARRRLAAGIDPSAERLAAKLATADTFEAIGREWLKVQQSKLSAATLAKAEWMLTLRNQSEVDDLVCCQEERAHLAIATDSRTLSHVRRLNACRVRAMSA
jgi:hypothetical protein